MINYEMHVNPNKLTSFIFSSQITTNSLFQILSPIQIQPTLFNLFVFKLYSHITMVDYEIYVYI